ncbi:hypothetical protein HYFRA_00010847 [Hymenoscyphus fraxineus]|uniref:Uncharacterized protein n=1 Tax=Hymenoscyphus fraxineus TaxID=746836 RepID=A0A9N9PNS8_9HELO|nr:hypothetical protein HYFRA_00010847 [Hymenoscyphus fraxineus]
MPYYVVSREVFDTSRQRWLPKPPFSEEFFNNRGLAKFVQYWRTQEIWGTTGNRKKAIKDTNWEGGHYVVPFGSREFHVRFEEFATLEDLKDVYDDLDEKRILDKRPSDIQILGSGGVSDDSEEEDEERVSTVYIVERKSRAKYIMPDKEECFKDRELAIKAARARVRQIWMESEDPAEAKRSTVKFKDAKIYGVKIRTCFDWFRWTESEDVDEEPVNEEWWSDWIEIDVVKDRNFNWDKRSEQVMERLPKDLEAMYATGELKEFANWLNADWIKNDMEL